MAHRDSSSPEQEIDEQDLEQAIATVENSLRQLKQRYYQVKADQERLKDLKSQASQTSLKTELKQLQKDITTIELNLESRLFQWKKILEPFWQAVRFGGIGVIIGWILKSCAS